MVSATRSAFFFSNGERDQECVLFSAGEHEREHEHHFDKRANALHYNLIFTLDQAMKNAPYCLEFMFKVWYSVRKVLVLAHDCSLKKVLSQKYSHSKTIDIHGKSRENVVQP